MQKPLIILACIGALALPACEGLTRQEQIVAGGLTGAALGFITASALNANPNWTILAVLAGAAAGTLVARNYVTNECAYAVGDGRYRVRRCP